MAAAGGTREILTTPDATKGELDHYWPEILPDGTAVLFTIMPAAGLGTAQVAVLDLETGSQTVLIRGGSHAQYIDTGHLIYVSAGTMYAVSFDLQRRQVQGVPAPVLSGVLTSLEGRCPSSC